MIKKLLLLIVCVFIFSCNSDEYSPNQVFNRKTATNVNEKQIALLNQKTASNTIRIAFSGDTQRSYAAARDFVTMVNARNDIDFVILNGDISDFGLLTEFDAIYDIYAKLKVPFISVIGNHDLVANGKDIYKRMFGPLNFTFTYGNVKFVCHDTNSREYNFDGSTPNLPWLKENLKTGNGITHLISVAHIAPFGGDFDPALMQPYKTLLNQTPNLIASLHSHNHSKLQTFYQDGNSGVPFIITNAIYERAYTIFDISNGQINAQEINF